MAGSIQQCESLDKSLAFPLIGGQCTTVSKDGMAFATILSGRTQCTLADPWPLYKVKCHGCVLEIMYSSSHQLCILGHVFLMPQVVLTLAMRDWMYIWLLLLTTVGCHKVCADFIWLMPFSDNILLRVSNRIPGDACQRPITVLNDDAMGQAWSQDTVHFIDNEPMYP
jgi:hypothetical protein